MVFLLRDSFNFNELKSAYSQTHIREIVELSVNEKFSNPIFSISCQQILFVHEKQWNNFIEIVAVQRISIKVNKMTAFSLKALDSVFHFNLKTNWSFQSREKLILFQQQLIWSVGQLINISLIDL